MLIFQNEKTRNEQRETGSCMFAAIFIPDFALEAIVRGEPLLRERPVAVLEGAPPLERVIITNAKAQNAGAAVGLTKAQAEQAPGVVLRAR